MNQAEGCAGQTAECVDLDGTLLRTDLLYESVAVLLRANPLYLFALPLWLLRGKAHLKRQIALRVTVPIDTLPFEERVLKHLRDTPNRSRVLCTASDGLLARPVAEHLGLFEEVIASDGHINLGGRAKADALIKRFGERGFDYFGNSRADLHVWRHARNAWVVNASASLVKAASQLTTVAGYLPPQHAGGALRTWLKAIRVHQWLKNILVFVPLLAAHAFLDASSLLKSSLAFAAFSLCASGVYLFNDLLDLPADREHPRKRNRPFASGRLPLQHGLVAAPLLTASGFIVAMLCGWDFALVLAVYYISTLAYSLRLKRVEMLDVMLLAGLYTVRIIGGAVAISVPLSFWLLAFSMFVFLSLAMLKRYTELHDLSANGKQQASGRGYLTGDLPLLQSLGGASGYIAVLVLALYINSPESLALYAHPQVLWLLCPVLLYWVGRAWAVSHRGRMHDDPVVFAVTDRVSQLLILLCGIIVLGAI